MVVAVVAIDHKSAHVLDDASLGERMRGRRVHAVVADQLDADRARSQTWIVERGDRRFAGLGHEHVCRSIVRTGRERHRRARWDRRDKIAFAGVQSLAHEPAPLGAPDELQRPMEMVGDQTRRSCSRNRLQRNWNRADCSDRRRPSRAAHQLRRTGRRRRSRARTATTLERASRLTRAPEPEFTSSPSPSAGRSRHESAPRSRVPCPCITRGRSRTRSICRERGHR